MNYKTQPLDNGEAFALLQDNLLDETHHLVIGGVRIPFGKVSNPAGQVMYRPLVGGRNNEWIDYSAIQGMLRNGFAHIERTIQKVNPFDAPEFTGWGCHGKPPEAGNRYAQIGEYKISVYCDGSITYSKDNQWGSRWLSGKSPVIEANLLEVARLINRLASDMPGPVVASAVLAYVDHKEKESQHKVTFTVADYLSAPVSMLKDPVKE